MALEIKIGKTYKLQYRKNDILYRGTYEIMRRQGRGFYLYADNGGIDLYMDKQGLSKAIEDYKNNKKL